MNVTKMIKSLHCSRHLIIILLYPANSTQFWWYYYYPSFADKLRLRWLRDLPKITP